MKKKFILLAMLLLTLVGVKLNVLNAQETVETYVTRATNDVCVVEFILKDSYSDTWNGNYLSVSYGGTPTNLTLDENVAEKTYTLQIPSGTTVTVQYVKGQGYYT